MRHFKLPLIVTGITLVVALLVGVIGVTSIHRARTSNYQKEQRSKDLGTAVAIVSLFVIFPFWILAAGKVGKERRARQQGLNEPGNTS